MHRLTPHSTLDGARCYKIISKYIFVRWWRMNFAYLVCCVYTNPSRYILFSLCFLLFFFSFILFREKLFIRAYGEKYPRFDCSRALRCTKLQLRRWNNKILMWKNFWYIFYKYFIVGKTFSFSIISLLCRANAFRRVHWKICAEWFRNCFRVSHLNIL